MIDTVRFKRALQGKSSSRKVLGTLKGGWRKLPNNHAVRIRFFPVAGGTVDMVEVSLPTLLHGNNVRLLDSQAAVDRALQMLDEALAVHFVSVTTKEDIFTRADVCWNFQCNPTDFLLAHEAINHPEVNHSVCSYRNRIQKTGLTWNGSKLRITFYDKTADARKAKLVPAKLVRVEVCLRGEKLREYLSGNTTTPLVRLDIADCYRTFRSILLKFPPNNPILILEGWDDVAFAAWKKGIPIYDILGKKLHSRTISDLRQRLARRQPRSLQIDWDWMLPEQFPPRKTIGRPRIRKVTLD